MKKNQVKEFCKALISEENRKNRVTITGINTSLINAALNAAFVNESCKSTGMVSKSQVIYRKLDGKSIEECQDNFRERTVRFMKMLRIFSRNRKFIISFDETEEDYWGELDKNEDNLYIHEGCENPKAKYHYYYMTVAITSNDGTRYILDGKILKRGEYKEDVVEDMCLFVKKHLAIDVALFDRGFGWGIIYKLRKMKINYLIFWKKQGNWYKKFLDDMKDGEMCSIKKSYKYNRNKSNYKVDSNFVIVKQCEYKNKKYDWIFATNLRLNNATKYVKRYKKRWGIETIFRVNDKIRIYTTSTNPVIRYFLFLFTCFVYNIWKYFQTFIGEDFSLANFKTNMIIFLTKYGMVYPKHFDKFEAIALNKFKSLLPKDTSMSKFF